MVKSTILLMFLTINVGKSQHNIAAIKNIPILCAIFFYFSVLNEARGLICSGKQSCILNCCIYLDTVKFTVVTKVYCTSSYSGIYDSIHYCCFGVPQS